MTDFTETYRLKRPDLEEQKLVPKFSECWIVFVNEATKFHFAVSESK